MKTKPNYDYIFGYDVLTNKKVQCIEILFEWVNGIDTRYLACLNPHSVEVSFKDDIFRSALLNSDMLIPDGIGIVYASKILNAGEIKERITGSDIFNMLSSKLDLEGGFSCFFLGTNDKTLEKISSRYTKDYPNINISGMLSPPYRESFSDEDNKRMVDRINNSAANVLWVGMSAPKQEKWIYNNIENLNVELAVPIGAVFDFYADNVKRPGRIAQELGMEWMVRQVKEIMRLRRRFFITQPKFMGRTILGGLKNRINSIRK